MQGFVFKDFLEFANRRLGNAVVDQSLAQCQLESRGVYSTRQQYDPRELLTLVGELSRQTGHSSSELLQSYGQWLFTTLVNLPLPMRPFDDSFSFLEAVEEGFHREIRELFPHANLPRLHCERLGPHEMTLEYQSPLGLADLAHGLLQGCCEHFHEAVEIGRESLAAGGTHVRFQLRRS
jgi:hypothetical protein